MITYLFNNYELIIFKIHNFFALQKNQWTLILCWIVYLINNINVYLIKWPF